MAYLRVKKGRIKKGEGWVVSIPLEKEVTTIGRAQSNDLQLAHNKRVSRHHAAIIRLKNPSGQTESHFVRDLGSLHFTRVNGEIVFRGLLENRDVLEIENFRLEYRKEQPPEDKKRCPIEILDTKPKKIIQDIAKGNTIFLSDHSDEQILLLLPFSKKQALLDLLSLVRHADSIQSLLKESIEPILRSVDADMGFIALITENNEIGQYATAGESDNLQIYQGLVNKLIQGRCYRNSLTVAVPIPGAKRVLGFIYLSSEQEGIFGKKDLDLLNTVASSMGKRIEAISSHERPEKLRRRGDEIFEWPIEMVTQSKKMSGIYSNIKRLAPTDLGVLILGETGSGKELVAREIHRLSSRTTKPYVVVDCTQLHDLTHTRSELFGHKKGSFTGASSERIGAFQLAHKGTIFLDEIGEISLDVQAELLRAIDAKEIKPLGSDRTIKVDVRILVATNHDLDTDVNEGKFREDLFHRLKKGLVIKLPSLHDRREDIPVLAHFFVDKYAMKHSRNLKGISHGTMRTFIKYPWPGNIRELEGCIESAILRAPEGKELLFLWDLPDEIQKASLEGKEGEKGLKSLSELEKEEIERVLASTDGNVTKAAKILGITRPTLYKKMNEYPIAAVKKFNVP